MYVYVCLCVCVSVSVWGWDGVVWVCVGGCVCGCVCLCDGMNLIQTKCSIYRLSVNVPKNRYGNVSAADQTRVTLTDATPMVRMCAL